MTSPGTRRPVSSRPAGDEAVPSPEAPEDAGGATLEQLEGLNRATFAVSRATGVQAILCVVAAAALQLVSSRACAAWALDPHGGRALSEIVRVGPDAADRRLGVDFDDSPLRSHVFEARGPLRLSAAELTAGSPGSADGRLGDGERPLGSYLAGAAPRARDGRALGVLELLDRIEGEFTAAEQSMLVQLAQAAAGAVEIEILREVFTGEQDRLRLAVVVAEVGTWCVDLKTGLDTRDATVNGILGLAPVASTQPRDDFLSYVHPDDRPRVRRAIDGAFDAREAYSIEFRIVRADGAVRWIRSKGRIFTGPEGTAEQFAGVACDVTETRYLKDRRDQALVQLQTSLSTSFVGTYIRDCRTNYINADEGLQRLFGFPPDTTTPLHDYGSRIHPDDRDIWATLVNRTRNGDASECEYRVVWPDGSVHWVFDKGEMIFDGEGNHLYTAGACADVTYHRQVEEERAQLLARERAARREAEEASRAKDEFLVTISHELRTPLTAVLGWAQILRAGRLDADRVRKGVEIIERNARAQASLIEDLLDVSRIVTGKMRMERDPVSLATVAEAALETIRQGAEAKQITLHLEADASMGVGEVVGDQDRLQQVVRNLLSNAVKFTSPGGRISVCVRRADPYAEVVVSDTGQGIPVGFLPFVFDRFRQAESGMTRAHGGLGLGLAIVRDIVEMHGGTVSVASEGEGRGALFTVRLPASAPVSRPDAKGKEAAEGSADRSPLVGIKALVVEDEADTRALISLILEQSGARVVTVSSAKDARAALATARPDVIVSDIGMPVENGYAFMSGLRALGPPLGSIPAVALTAYTRTEDSRRALAVGFQAHIPKPIDAARLVAAVERFARGHAC